MLPLVLVALIKIGLVIGGLMTAAAYLVLGERWIAAWIQDRLGPNRVGVPLTKIRLFGLGQPLADGVKFLFKAEYTPAHVDKGLYFFAPMTIFVTAIAVFAVIPFGSFLPAGIFPASWGVHQPIELVIAPGVDVGMIFVFAMGSIAVYGVVLGGWASNNKYSFLGGLRSNAELIAYELPLGLGILGVQGKEKFLELPEPLAVLEKFSAYPEIQVIDLDAAMSKAENNAEIVRDLCRRKPCRVGGGIRTVERAKAVVGDGALKAIVGSSAFTARGIHQEFLYKLVAAVPQEKILIAVDSFGDRVAIHGWRETLPLTCAQALPQLEPYCSGFLCTYIDGEGRLQGTNIEWFRSLRAVTKLPITAAGGITTDEEIAALEQLGMHAALGMSIYRKVFPELFAGRQPEASVTG